MLGAKRRPFDSCPVQSDASLTDSRLPQPPVGQISLSCQSSVPQTLPLRQLSMSVLRWIAWKKREVWTIQGSSSVRRGRGQGMLKSWFEEGTRGVGHHVPMLVSCRGE